MSYMYMPTWPVQTVVERPAGRWCINMPRHSHASMISDYPDVGLHALIHGAGGGRLSHATVRRTPPPAPPRYSLCRMDAVE